MTVDWLVDTYRAPLELLTDFLYPGHGKHRMHGTPNRYKGGLNRYSPGE